MIESESQLERTRAQIAGFRQQVDKIATDNEMPQPVKDSVLQSHQGMIAKLEAEVAEYLKA